MKIKERVLISLIFIVLNTIAFVVLYLVWVNFPQENILWLENNYKGFFKYAIITCFTFSVLVSNYFNSIKFVRFLK